MCTHCTLKNNSSMKQYDIWLVKRQTQFTCIIFSKCPSYIYIGQNTFKLDKYCEILVFNNKFWNWAMGIFRLILVYRYCKILRKSQPQYVSTFCIYNWPRRTRQAVAFTYWLSSDIARFKLRIFCLRIKLMYWCVENVRNLYCNLTFKKNCSAYVYINILFCVKFCFHFQTVAFMIYQFFIYSSFLTFIISFTRATDGHCFVNHVEFWGITWNEKHSYCSVWKYKIWKRTKLW